MKKFIITWSTGYGDSHCKIEAHDKEAAEKEAFEAWHHDAKKLLGPSAYEGEYSAQEYTKKLALAKQVTVYLDEGNRSRCKYERMLAYIQLHDRMFLNEVLFYELLVITTTPLVLTLWYLEIQLFNLNYKMIKAYP